MPAQEVGKELRQSLSPGLPGDPAWYLIHTHSRHEAKVEMGMQYLGLEVFLPRVTVRSRRRDRVRFLGTPLFPGYLFVLADLNTPLYYRIIQHHGVVRILGHKGQYTPVPAETVDSLRKIVASGLIIDPWFHLVKGKRVVIVGGPLAGATGIILRKKSEQRRLVVAVDLLGRSVAVDLAEEAVELCR